MILPDPTPIRAAAERSEQDAIAGVLPIMVGGILKKVPVLRIRQCREWKNKQLARIANTDITETADVAAFMAALTSVATDMILEAVCAYDLTGALGGRDWLEDNADDRELWQALEGMVAASFPFAGAQPLHSAVAEYGAAVKGLITLRMAAYGVKLAQAISTPGSSSEADSATPTSMTASPTSSSSSPGPTANGGTPEPPAIALS